jgi:hypothetical protein
VSDYNLLISLLLMALKKTLGNAVEREKAVQS